MRRLRSQPAGYTLLEICIVIVIITVLSGLVVPLTKGLIVEQRLLAVGNAFRDLAFDARRHAIDEGIPYAIRFDSEALKLAPWSGREAAALPAVVEVKIPRDLWLEYRNDPQKKWEKRVGQSWLFQAGGLCEYAEIRVGLAKSWTQIAFNPLTANGREIASHSE